MGDSNPRGLAPNTLSKSAGPCSAQPTGVRDLRRSVPAVRAGLRRMQVNETTTETTSHRPVARRCVSPGEPPEGIGSDGSAWSGLRGMGLAVPKCELILAVGRVQVPELKTEPGDGYADREVQESGKDAAAGRHEEGHSSDSEQDGRPSVRQAGPVEADGDQDRADDESRG